MAYNAVVVRIMVASPRDVDEEREQARLVISEWNDIHSMVRGIVLLPIGWETHSSPELSGRPQEIINDRLLKDCDVLLGIFWTRLGSPTGSFASGTVEEIERHQEAKKPSLIYFSNKAIPPSELTAGQYSALAEFRKKCEQRGLVENFTNTSEFSSKLRKQLQIFMNGYEPKVGTPEKALSETELAEVEKIKISDKLLKTVMKTNTSGSTSQNSLTPQAISILMEASKTTDGAIGYRKWIGGQSLGTSQVQFFSESANRREVAEWENALTQLEKSRFIEKQSDNIYVLTAAGYRVADVLLETNGTANVIVPR